MHACSWLRVPVETLVHVMVGLGSPLASQARLAVLSAGKDTVLIWGSAILGLDLKTGTCGQQINRIEILTAVDCN